MTRSAETGAAVCRGSGRGNRTPIAWFKARKRTVSPSPLMQSALRESNPPVQLGRLVPEPIGQGHVLVSCQLLVVVGNFHTVSRPSLDSLELSATANCQLPTANCQLPTANCPASLGWKPNCQRSSEHREGRLKGGRRKAEGGRRFILHSSDFILSKWDWWASNPHRPV